MNSDIYKLINDLAEYDDDAVLGLLYAGYLGLNEGDNGVIAAQFTKLDDVLDKLTLREQDRVLDLTCDLCSEHEKRGFLSGVRMGAKLILELE